MGKDKSKSRSPKTRSGFATGPNAANVAAAGAAAAAEAAQPVVVVEDPETALAKKQVLAKLTDMKKIEPKEERAKAFRVLLREWHPDKNAHQIDKATAVFQFLQKGKSLLSPK